MKLNYKQFLSYLFIIILVYSGITYNQHVMLLSLIMLVWIDLKRNLEDL